MGLSDANGHDPDGLPGLPPEWGRVVVPDDAAALAEEAQQLRRELAVQAGRIGPSGAGPPATGTGRTPYRMRRPGTIRRTGSLAVPLAMLLVAVLTTVAGLIGTGWLRPQRVASRPEVVPQVPAASPPGRVLPALDLVDADQRPVPLRGLLPAVILLVDECRCTAQTMAMAAIVPPGVAVVTVVSGRSTPGDPAPTAGPGAPVRPLADPAGGLRAFLRLRPAPDTAAALLVDRSGTLVRVLPVVGPVEQYRTDLAQLGSG